MKRNIKSKLLAVAFTALLAALALPSLARAEVRVNVGAIEYNNTVTVVSVLAVSYPVEDPEGWELAELFLTHPGDGVLDLLEGTTPEVHTFPLLGSKLWVVKIRSGVVDNTTMESRDTVTAIVDVDTAPNPEDTATCGPGVRRTQITAICK